MAISTRRPPVGATAASVLTSSVASADAIADPAQADGTTVNNTYLQGLLDTPGVARVRIPRGAGGVTWVLNAPLVASSGQTLDFRGASFTYPAGTSGSFIVNDAKITAVATTRDSNIKIVGGTYNRPPNQTLSGLGNMNIMLAFVDGVEVSELKVTSSGGQSSPGIPSVVGGKYGVYIYGCTQFEVHHITFATQSDGVHITASASHGHVHHIYGTCNDDMVALTPRDNVYWEITGQVGGDHEHIVIEHIYPSAAVAANSVLLLTGKSDDGATLYNSRNITVRHVDANNTGTGKVPVKIGGSSSPTYPNLNGGTFLDLDLSDIRSRGVGKPAVWIRDGVALVRSVRLAQLAGPGGVELVLVDEPHVESLLIEQCTYPTTSGSFPLVRLHSTAVVDLLTLRNNRVLGSAAGTGSALAADVGSLLTRLVERDVTVQNGQYSFGSLAGTTEVVLADCRSDTQQGYLFLRAAAVVTVRGSNVLTATGTDGSTYEAGGQITSFSPQFRGDVTKFNVAAGAQLWNTNAAAACGVGPVLCSGTSWTNSVTGAVLAGPGAPGAPTAVTATPQGSGTVRVAFTPTVVAGNPNTDFSAQFKRTVDTAWSTFAHPASAAGPVSVTGLTNGTGYDFQVADVNGAGIGAYSAVVSATPAAPAPAAARGATPATTAPTHWYRSDDLVAAGATDGSAVPSVADAGSAATAAVTNTVQAGTAPTLLQYATGGRPAISFRRALTQKLKFGTVADATGQSQTMVVVFRCVNLANNTIVLNGVNGTDAGYLTPAMRIQVLTTGAISAQTAGEGAAVVSPAGTIAVNTWHVMRLTFAADYTPRVWLDGALILAGTAGTAAPQALTTNTLGGYGNATSDLDIGELVTFRSVLSDTDGHLWDAYEANLYALTLTA